MPLAAPAHVALECTANRAKLPLLLVAITAFAWCVVQLLYLWWDGGVVGTLSFVRGGGGPGARLVEILPAQYDSTSENTTTHTQHESMSFFQAL